MARALTARELRELQAYLHIWNPEFRMGSSQTDTIRAYDDWVSHNTIHLSLQGIGSPPPFTNDHLSRFRDLFQYSTRFEGEGESERENPNYIRNRALTEYRENVINRLIGEGHSNRSLSASERALAEVSTLTLARTLGATDFRLSGEGVPPFPANLLMLIQHPAAEAVIFPSNRRLPISNPLSMTRGQVDAAMVEVIREYAFGSRLYDRLRPDQTATLEFAIDTLARNYMPSPVASMDGRFTQTEILGDLRAVMSLEHVRRLFERTIPERERTNPETTTETVLHVSPVPDYVSLTSPYGDREYYAGGATVEGHHQGHDFAYLEDRTSPNVEHMIPINATAAGEVVWAGYHEDYGNCIVLRHRDGTFTLYGHMDNPEIFGRRFEIGDQVGIGQQLGYMGNSGRVRATGWEGLEGTHNYRFLQGRHLHYEQITQLDVENLQTNGTFGADGVNTIRRIPVYASGRDFETPYEIPVFEQIRSIEQQQSVWLRDGFESGLPSALQPSRSTDRTPPG